MDNLFDQAAERIGRVYETEMLRRSYFHLNPCGGCGCPSFGQPCAVCGHYPRGERPTPVTTSLEERADRFRRSVLASAPEGKGNIATWYFKNLRKTVAYEKSPSFRQKADLLFTKGTWMGALPDPDAVFRHVVVDGHNIGRPHPSVEAGLLWRVMDEIYLAFEKETQAGATTPYLARVRIEAGEAMVQAVGAIHGNEEDWEPALSGLSKAIGDYLSFRPAGWVPVGNLVSARGMIEEIRERCTQAVAAPTP